MIELPKLQDSIAITDADGKPTFEFHRWWQEIARTLEGQLNTINSQLATLITAAQTTATAAQVTADAVTLSDKITASYVLPAVVLSAADAGTDCTVTIAAHARVYGDGTKLDPVAGGTITGLAYTTVYSIYYDDITCANSSPTYLYTTTASNALNNFVTGRHFVGLVTTPAAGAGATSGGSTPPGSDPADKHQYSTL